MKLQTARMSTRALGVLQRNTSFAVRCLFDRVVNLESHGETIAIQSGNVAFTPLSVEVGHRELESFKEAVPGYGWEIRLGHVEAVDCRIDTAAAAKPPSWTELLCRAMLLFAKDDSLAPAADERLWRRCRTASPVQLCARAILREARLYMQQQRYPACAQVLSGLCGLGGGLTPAGDDFLLGALAVCSFWPGERISALRSTLSAMIRTAVARTTWLSRAFLSCALARDFALPIHRVLRAGSNAELLQAVAEAGAFGHTSGSDTLGGILWMAEAARGISD